MATPEINPFAILVRMMMGQPSSPSENPSAIPPLMARGLPAAPDQQPALPNETQAPPQMVPVNEQRPDPYQMLNEIMAKIPGYYPPAKRTKGELIATFLQPAAAGFASAMAGPRYQRNRRFWGGAVGSAAPLALQEAYRPEIMKQQRAAAQQQRIMTAADIMKSLHGYYSQRTPGRVWAADPSNPKQEILHEVGPDGGLSVATDAMGRPVTRPSSVEKAVQKEDATGIRSISGGEVPGSRLPADAKDLTGEPIPEEDRTDSIRFKPVQYRNELRYTYGRPGRTSTTHTAEELKSRIAEAYEKKDMATVKQLQGELKAIDPLGAERTNMSRARSLRPTAGDKKDAKAARVFQVSDGVMRTMESQGFHADSDPVAFYRRAAETIERSVSDPRASREDRALVDPILRRLHTELTRRYPRQKAGLDSALRDILGSAQ